MRKGGVSTIRGINSVKGECSGVQWRRRISSRSSLGEGEKLKLSGAKESIRMEHFRRKELRNSNISKVGEGGGPGGIEQERQCLCARTVLDKTKGTGTTKLRYEARAASHTKFLLMEKEDVMRGREILT